MRVLSEQLIQTDLLLLMVLLLLLMGLMLSLSLLLCLQLLQLLNLMAIIQLRHNLMMLMFLKYATAKLDVLLEFELSAEAKLFEVKGGCELGVDLGHLKKDKCNKFREKRRVPSYHDENGFREHVL